MISFDIDLKDILKISHSLTITRPSVMTLKILNSFRFNDVFKIVKILQMKLSAPVLLS